MVLLVAAILAGCSSAQKKSSGSSETEKVDPALVGKIVDYKTYYSDGSILGEGKALYKAVMNKPVYIKQQKWIQYYKGTNTIKQAEGEYKEDKQTGVWKLFFKDGKVQQEGTYTDGIATGQWTIYYPTGEVNWKAVFSIVNIKDDQTGDMKKNGQIEGVKTSYFKSGKVWKEEEMHSGKKNGRNQEYYEAGNPKEIAMYKDDLKNGALNEYWPNAKPKTQGMFIIADVIDKKTGKPTGDKIESKTGNWKMFYNNGQPAVDAVFGDNKPEGTWRFYSREGLLMKEGRYKAGKEDGPWTYYEYENGRKMISMELDVQAGMVGEKGGKVYQNGQFIGEGQLKRIPVKALFQIIKNGQNTEVIDAQNQPDDDDATKTTSKWTGKWKPIDRNGAFTEYFPGTHAKKIEATYMIGKLNGKYKEYYPNGKIKVEGEYLANKKNGIFTFYNADGSTDSVQSGQYMSDKLFGKKK